MTTGVVIRILFFSVIVLFLVSCGAQNSSSNLCADCKQTPDAAQPKSLDQAVIDRLPVMMDAYGVDGMVVVAVSGQQTLLSEGYGVTKDGERYTPDTPCPIYSATKVFTSLAIASLVEDGMFDVNTELGEHLADVPDEWANIPFWRLLNHSSGITMIVNKPFFEELAEDPLSGNVDVYNFVSGFPLDYNPGEYSRYRQSGYGIAEMILSDQFDTNWPALVAQHVTAPANTSGTVYTDMENGKRSVPLMSSAGGFQTTSNDMAAIFMSLNRGEIVSPIFLEEWLHDEAYNFGGYSLGSVLGQVGDVRTIGHSGGGRANLRYAPQKEVGIMVCTDDQSNNTIMHDVTNMLMREIATEGSTLLPIQTGLHARSGKNAADIISFYEAEKSANPPNFDFTGTEQTLNQIGYNLLASNKTNDAIEIFQLNTREHPSSANTFDSLGEALFAAERYEYALQNYRKVLELNPDNENAIRMIEKINSVQAE